MKKIEAVNKAERFLAMVKDMTEQVNPDVEPTLSNSWKIIKAAVKDKSQKNSRGS